MLEQKCFEIQDFEASKLEQIWRRPFWGDAFESGTREYASTQHAFRDRGVKQLRSEALRGDGRARGREHTDMPWRFNVTNVWSKRWNGICR